MAKKRDRKSSDLFKLPPTAASCRLVNKILQLESNGTYCLAFCMYCKFKSVQFYNTKLKILN